MLTPTFQYARFLGDALRSTLLQEGLELEHVVQDGGSSDGTVELLERTGGNVSWVSEPDRGQSDALNRALARARGKWIGWLNADEFYLPGALATLVDFAERRGVDVAYGDVVFVDERGRFLRLVPQHPFSLWILRRYGPFIGSCASIFRRDALGEKAWDVGIQRIMDWDLYLRLATQGAQFAWVPYPVAAFRVHSAQITARPSVEDRESYTLVRSRWQIPDSWVSRELGRFAHGIAKLKAGSYVRQARARSLRGRSLRWFAEPEGRETAATLLKRVYEIVQETSIVRHL